jgi:phosphohistidine phosphatase
MRHASAVQRGTPGYPDDTQRPLTQEGLDQARQAAKALKRLKVEVDLILTSPYLRAAQTAERVAEVYKGVPLRGFPALQAEALPPHTSQALEGRGIAHVLLVGHEPHLSAWAAELVSPRSDAAMAMKKGGVACIEVDSLPPRRGSGTLRWLLTPKQLALIAKG